MSLFHLFEANGETGGWAAEWSEAIDDSSSMSATMHYSDLAKMNPPIVPYSGAYAFYIDLAKGGGSDDVVCQETTLFDSVSTWGVGFALWVDSLTMAASDRFTIFRLRSGGNTDEAVIDIRNNAGTIEILAAETGSASTVRAVPLVQGQWHWIEAWGTVNAGSGTIYFAIDGNQQGLVIGSLTQSAITDGSAGVIGVDATTTAGHVVFGKFIFNSAQIGWPGPRYPRQKTVTKSEHLFIGPGSVCDLKLLSTDSGNVVRLYDTDTGSYTAAQNFVAEIATGSVKNTNELYTFRRGCFVYMASSLTAPRCQARIMRGDEGYHHPFTEAVYYSDEAVKQYAYTRTVRPGNV